MNFLTHDSNIVSDLLEIYSRDPFYSPVQFCKERSIDGRALEELVYSVKHSKHLSNIVLQGPAKQYWKSIESIRNRTNFDSAVQGISAYPSRLGLYPGISCQFRCQFCGRREGTEYAGKLAKDSLELFDRILTDHVQVPNHEKTIRLSGGLEPTTNKYITDIVRLIHGHGLQVELYTNGFNFVDSWLEKQPGIFEIDRIRFSIYGHDSKSYTEFTEHEQSGTVLDNIKRFLDLSSMPIGVNYVILHQQLGRFSKFIDWIEEVNSSTRGFDWISLREDSSQNHWQLDTVERNEIHSRLQRLESAVTGQSTIDYGYTLWPLRDGTTIGGIKQAAVADLLPKAFPQISTVVDVEGNVYPYHDVFPNRAGQDKHCIGKIGKNNLQQVVDQWVTNSNKIKLTEDDLKFLDTSDHMITLLIKQQQELNSLGVYQWLV